MVTRIPSTMLSWSAGKILRLARAFAWIAFAVLALTAALVAIPGLVDWQSHKPRLEAFLSSATGRTVSLDGPVSVELLPHPVMVINNVRLGNAPGAPTPAMLEARRLAIRLSWLAILQGRIEIVRVVLDEPRLVLEPGADGRPNWWLPAFEAAGGDRPSFLPVTLDRVEIRGGRLVHAGGLIGQPMEVDAIDLVVTFDSSRNQATLAGAAVVNGLPARLGLVLNTGLPVLHPVDLAVDLPGGRVAFTGWPGRRSSDDPLRGRLAVEAAFLPEFVESLTRVLGRPPVRTNEAVLRRVEASGDILFDGRRLTIDGLSLVTEGERIRGKLQIDADDVVAVGGRLSAASLDADRWLERLHEQPLLVPASGSSGAASAAEKPRLRLALTVEAASLKYRRDIVRDLVVSFEVENDVFNLREASAILPGDFHLHRRVGFEGDKTHPGYDGVIQVDARNLRRTMKWIGIDTDSLPPDRLQTLRLNGRTRPVKGVVHVADATFSLDGQAGTVAADIALAIPTVISARLHLPQLDLDAYSLTGTALGGMVPRSPTQAGAGDVEPPLIEIIAALDQVTYRGEPAHRVDAHFAIRGNQLSLRHVSVGDLLGAQLDVSGSVADFGTAPRFELKWRGRMPDADRMIEYAALPRFAHGRIGAARVSGHSVGTLQEARLSKLSLAMLGADIAAEGEVTFGTELRFDFAQWSLVTPDIGKLAAVATGNLYRPMPAVHAHGTFQGDVREAAFRGDLTVDGMMLAGEISSTLGARPRIAASLRASREVRLDHWMPAAPASGAAHTVHAWSSNPAAESAPAWPPILRGFDGTVSLSAPVIAWGPYMMADFALSARLEHGLLSVDRLSGTVAGASVHLSATMDSRRGPLALALDGSLRDINVPGAIAFAHTANDFGTDDLAVALEGRFSLQDLSLRTEGETFESLLLSASGSARYEGEIRPVVTRGSLSLASLATGIGRLFSTQMGFASAVIDNFVDRWIATRGVVEIGDGVITLREHTLNSPGATAYITSRIDARNGTLDTLIDLDNGKQGTIDYSMSLRGPLAAPTLAVEPRRGR